MASIFFYKKYLLIIIHAILLGLIKKTNKNIVLIKFIDKKLQSIVIIIHKVNKYTTHIWKSSPGKSGRDYIDSQVIQFRQMLIIDNLFGLNINIWLQQSSHCTLSSFNVSSPTCIDILISQNHFSPLKRVPPNTDNSFEILKNQFKRQGQQNKKENCQPKLHHI